MLTLILNQAKSETIDGPANVRDTVNGKVLFSLENSVEVESSEIKDNWYFIGLVVKLPKGWKEWYFPKDTELRDANDNYLGKTLNDVKIYTKQDGENCELTVLSGYTYKSNITESSIIENQLIEILEGKSELTKMDFKSHISENDYQDDNQFGWIETYIFYETWIEDPSPGARIRLIFENEILIGIIHTREIELKDKKDYKILYGWKFLSFMETNDPRNEKIIEMYKTFLNSVD